MAETAVGVFVELVNAVKEIRKKVVMFNHTLATLHSILDAITPVISEIEQRNNELGYSKVELKSLITLMKAGKDLVSKCSNIGRHNYVARVRYLDQLEALKQSLLMFFNINMNAQVFRDQKETLSKVSSIENTINELKSSLKVDASSDSHHVPREVTESKINDSTKGQLSNEHEKKSYMLSADNLCIEWGNNPTYWRWASVPLFRYSKVAELVQVYWLEIEGEIDTYMLSPNTLYGAYLVFKHSNDGPYGFRNLPIKVSVGVAGEGDNRERRELYLAAATPHRLGAENDEGWMEVELGEFYNSGEGDKVLEIGVYQENSEIKKGGIIVQGIEIKAKNILNPDLLKHPFSK